MGWTSYHATYYKNGKVDKKKECDAYFLEGLNRGHFKVLKSSMVGNIYYAAIQNAVERVSSSDGNGYNYKPIENGTVWAAVFKVQVDNKYYFNFSYKDMSEDMGPFEANCPQSILKLLSETDNEFALEWRKRCWKNIEKKKSGNTLSALPIGSKISFRLSDGTKMELVKHAPAYQFKKSFWYNPLTHKYVSSRNIPNDYKVESKGE